MDVRMPDGTVIQNVPEGTSKAELQRRLSASQVAQEQAEDVGFLEAAGRDALGTFVDLMTGIPDAAATLGLKGIALMQPDELTASDLLNPPLALRDAGAELTKRLTGGRVDPVAAGQRFEEARPRVGQRVFPQAITPEAVQAGAQMAGEAAGAVSTGDFGQFTPFPEAMRQQQALTEEFRRQRPIASAVGQGAGNGMALLAGRAPIARGRAMQELRGTAPAPEMAFGSAAKTAPFQKVEMAPNLREALKTVFTRSKSVKTLLNRAGRATETGLEGAALQILNEGSDIEQAAFVAGSGQLAGSTLLGGLSGMFRGGPLKAGAKLALSAASVGALIQLAKSATPGGKDFSLESLESGFDKVLAGLTLGMLSGVAGAGRVTKRFPVSALPEIADTISALPRAAVLSSVSEGLKNATVNDVLQKVSSDPDFFGERAVSEINRAIRSNKKDALENTIDRLRRNNRTFREKFESLE